MATINNEFRTGYLQRQMQMIEGEGKLRKHIGQDAALRMTLVHRAFRSDDAGWFVIAKFLPDNGPAVTLGEEPIDQFPSDTLLAQALLVC